jgi:anti-anti-sigma factor
MRMTGSHASWLTARHAILLHSSPTEQWARTATWITAALARGEKVLYKTWPADRHAVTATRVAARVSPPGRPRQVEVVNLHGGRPGFDRIPPADALVAWHTEMLHRARAEGFPGVAFAGEHFPWPAARARPERLLSCDRTMDRLAHTPGMRVLCHFDASEESAALTDDCLPPLLQLHHRHVDDTAWGADVTGERIAVTGEIDLDTARRFGEVLSAATAAGVTTVDLSGVHLLSAAAMSVISRLASQLHSERRVLTLTDPPPLVLRTMNAVALLDHPGLRLRTGGAHDQRSLTITNEFRFSL